MTTYSSNGFVATFNGTTNLATSYSSGATLELVVSDATTTASYVTDFVNPGNFDDVTFNGFSYNIRVNGVDESTFSGGNGAEATFGQLVWDDGGTTRTSYLLSLENTTNGNDYIFVIGGDAVPVFASTAAFNSFLINDVISIGSAPNGSGFEAGANIPLAGIPGVSTSENDTVVGTSGADVYDTGAGDDNIDAGAGDDTLIGGAGGDILEGGTGTDTVDYSASNAFVNVQLQYNSAVGGHAAGDTLSHIENLTGSDFNDNLVGSPGVNVLVGGNGNDTLKGLNGADELHGGAGDDWLYVDNLDSVIDGGADTDRMIVTNGNGVTVDVGAGSIEIATGNTGNDTFDGSTATADLTLRGRSGDDVLTGGSGDDYIFGDAGIDQLVGGDGLDRLFVDENDTLIDGGAGIQDRVLVQQLASATTGVSIDMAASHVEVAFGNLKDDTFNGSASTDALSLYGRGGDDILTGGSANDRLFGDNDSGAGDILDGGQGNDFLRGGGNTGGIPEADQFVFRDLWGNDRIFDFADNGIEKIDFSNVAGIDEIGDLTITDFTGYAMISYTDTVSAAWTASIRVDGVTAAELGTGDFIFV